MGVRAEAGHIAPLDGVRGIAVLWVMLFHYVALAGARGDSWVTALRALPALDAVVRNGHLGVDLFFLVSGFLLALPWLLHARSERPPPSAAAFYERRWRRIAPAYYVQLALLFALAIPLLRGIDYALRDPIGVFLNAVAHAAFLHNTTPLTSGSLGANGALWTLAVEAQFYLLLPLLAPWFARRPVVATLAAFGIALAWQAGARHGLDGLVEAMRAIGRHWGWPEDVVRRLLATQLPAYLGHFAFGALMGRAWLAWRAGRFGRCARAIPLAGLAAAALLVALLTSGVPVWGEATWLLTTFALGVALLAAACGAGPVARALLCAGPLAFTGRVSYSAYLYHLPLLLLWNLHAPALAPAAALPLYLAVVLFVAWLSWRFVEQPFRENRGGQTPVDFIRSVLQPIARN